MQGAPLRVTRVAALAAAVAVLAVALVSFAVLRPAVGTVPPRVQRAAPQTFAFAIGSGTLGAGAVSRLSRYDLVVIDGEEAPRTLIAALRRRGTTVLAYLSVGTIEPGRPWSAAAARYRLEYWPDWGEWYADTARAGYRDLIGDHVAPALLAKGFDGLFLDNIDMVGSHLRQTAGMRRLVRGLAVRVHRRGGLLFAQNGDDTIGPFVADLDGWNREDVSSTYDFDRRRYTPQPAAEVRAAQATLRRLRARGLIVTTTDYVRSGDTAGAARAVANACAAGALPHVADIGLRRLPPPVTCP